MASDLQEAPNLEALCAVEVSDPQSAPLAELKYYIKSFDERLAADFHQSLDATATVRRRTEMLDVLLRSTWTMFGLNDRALTLAAVGGYGRAELHPHSDIDIAILVDESTTGEDREQLENWLRLLWDVGLKLGHAVRTPAECESEASNDLTIMTNLLEARFLIGQRTLFDATESQIDVTKLWPGQRFFAAKVGEQELRHSKYDNALQKLEPNLKESPGGLRDLHNLIWVAKSLFKGATLETLLNEGLLTATEHKSLLADRDFLWAIRCALHFSVGRPEDRLLFEYQKNIASVLGYTDSEGNRGVEQLMRRFYQTIRDLASLNEMLLDILKDHFGTTEDAQIQRINRRFQMRQNNIETTSPKVFKRTPSALLEIFLLVQQRDDIVGISAETIRQIRAHLYVIDDDFRDNIACRSLFLEIIRQPRGITATLRRMHRYGVLGAYLTEFAHVTGLMQFDLYHIYTVDEHTLFLIRNLRRFWVPKAHEPFPPHVEEVVGKLPKPELLYLGGLFHDIAKGRGGDHSEVGAEDAIRFCRRHDLSDFDGDVVAWLVRNHLLMSATAQKRDIQDPKVVAEFANRVGDQMHLNYLYLLTIADIRATNPELWTSWKATLLSELYRATLRYFRRGGAAVLEQEDRLLAVRSEAQAHLAGTGIAHGKLDELWATFDRDYFLRHRAEEIAWHTQTIIAARATGVTPLVAAKTFPARGCTAVLVYVEDMPNLFAVTASAIDRMHYNIQDARIITNDDGMALDTYVILNPNDGTTLKEEDCDKVVTAITDALLAGEVRSVSASLGTRRRLKQFSVKSTVNFDSDQHGERTIMELTAADRPGVLSIVGHALQTFGIRLQDARIGTVGERVEDYFFITDADGSAFTDPDRQRALAEHLCSALD